MQGAQSRIGRFRGLLRELYLGRTRRGAVFQTGLLVLDILVLAFFLATTFFPGATWVATVDLVLAAVFVAEFAGRMLAHRQPMRYLDNGAALIDLAVILSLVLSSLLDNLAFLRLLRTLRLLRSYQVLGRLKHQYAFVRRNDEAIEASLNLTVFVIMVSALVFVTQVRINPGITNFVDALYFTVTTLTTTGYGDIALKGHFGRLLSVAIMITGISLFFRLVQAVFRPGGKVRFPCPKCGLQRHDADAVHCKACGEVLNIPDDES